MTVTYTAEVATCRGLGCFIKLLRRWSGSIYKLVWLDLLLYLLLYYTLNALYRLVLSDTDKRIFENVVQYCKDYCDFIPISFVLGFYVSIVMTRWWNQYTVIPFPDTLAVFVSATIHGQDDRGRVMRRTIMRYACLSITMMFTMVSPKVKNRFPTLDHFVEAGLLQASERDILSNFNKKFPNYSKYWMPLVWAASIVTKARKEGRVRDDFAVKTIVDELNRIRGNCGLLSSFDTISIPLVYTQVVTLAVYTYFLTTLMGHQWVEGNQYKFDLYFPFFTTLQFFFYVGWLKVAETLINPFGYDDDDFEVNWMVDRNLQVSYLIVDEMHQDHPELVRDQYWDEVFPMELPYTLAAEPFKEHHPLPSTANISVMQSQADFVQPSQSLKTENFQTEGETGITFSVKPTTVNLKRGLSQTSTIGTSVPDSISRVNSVTSVLKKLFSRENSRSETGVDSHKESPIEMFPMHGTNDKTLIPPQQIKSQPNSVRITDQIIEEVDEQLTITSRKSTSETRPTVMNIFGKSSDPINMPKMKASNRHFIRNNSNETSHSAPTEVHFSRASSEIDDISIGSDTDSSENEFSKLKEERQKERRSRLFLNLARSASGNEGEHLLVGSLIDDSVESNHGSKSNDCTPLIFHKAS